MTRLLARRGDFAGKAFGVDHNRFFIEAACRFAHAENVSDRVEFRVGDAHNIDFSPATFDAVIAHTLISHVTEPAAVLREMARVARADATLVIFDGDYASLTFAYPDHDLGHRMDAALTNASFNNPLVMRDLPRLLPELGLEITAAWGHVVAEIGRGSYFKSFAETYAPYVASSGLLPGETVDAWLAAQRQSMEIGTFFASCNYYTNFSHRE